MEYAKSTTVKLTKAILAEATTTAKRVELRDSDTRGLVLRVSKTGGKVFTCKFRNGTRVITRMIGTPDRLELKEARALAAEIRAETIRATIRVGPRSDRIVTLRQLLVEAQPILAQRKKGGAIWNVRKHRTEPDAVAGIKSVFGPLLDKRAADIRASDLVACMDGHMNRQIRKQGEAMPAKAAPGASGRAAAYLSTLFDWAANRAKFRKLGSGRSVRISLPDLSEIYRPPTKGKPRERHLSSEEAGKLYSLLRNHRDDEGLAALYFQWVTASRISEVENAEFIHINLDFGVWQKRVKGGEIVPVGLPPALIRWIRSLPSYRDTGGKGPLFRNTKKTGPFMNWNAVSKRLQSEMNCEVWTRHDLRRTSTTAIATVADDAFARWELPTHKNPKFATDAAAEVHRLFCRAQQNGVPEHYEPHRSPWIINNRIARTRDMIAWLMQFYEVLADRVAPDDTDLATPIIASTAPDQSSITQFSLAS